MHHPTAVIDPGACLDSNVDVGPYAVIGPGVRIGAGTSVGAHAVIEGPTTLGCRNRIFPHAIIGAGPQDRRHRGGPTHLSIGDDNVIRELVTIHRGTDHGGGRTTIGSRSFFMAACHIAHDCTVGDNVVLANGALLAGHVTVGSWAVFGGLAAVGQFLRVGESAMVAAGAMVERDVPPFHIVSGDRARVRSLNVVGLRRRGLAPNELAVLEQAHRMLFRSGRPLSETLSPTRDELGSSTYVRELVDFLESSKKGLCAPLR